MPVALWWIRRDLRLSDNPALQAALHQGGGVIPVFILDPALLASPWVAETRLAFLFAGLRVLEKDLRRLGSYLVLRGGQPSEVLSTLLQETGAGRVFAEADYSPYARRRDERVARRLPLTLVEGLTIHPPQRILKADGGPYKRFTPFRQAWLALPWDGRVPEAPRSLVTPPGISTDDLPSLAESAHLGLFLAGEAEGLARLAEFSREGLHGYAGARNRMDLPGTSGLSPFLRFGMVSARQAALAVRQAGAATAAAGGDGGRSTGSPADPQVWLNELIWREFFIAILYHFPEVRQGSFREDLRRIRWREDPAAFAAWQGGRTGFPAVDAAMRQLSTTGWMHNRARMLAASFLAKDLLINWRWGELHFMKHLVDGDPAANNGGWQWTAGTGMDAAPYFRVFNPVLQGKKFDPLGNYVRKYVPELEHVPAEFIHAPWTMTAEQQRQFGCIIGGNYPAPIVEHARARERAANAYQYL